MVTTQEKAKYGYSPDRKNSFDDSLEVESMMLSLKSKYPNHEIIDKPYGIYGVDVVVRKDGKDILWVELERSMGWIGKFRYKTASFLERKYHFIEEAKQKGAEFWMCYFERNHNQIMIIDGEVIKQFEPFKKYLRSGSYDYVRHIDLEHVNFYDLIPHSENNC
jgi:hypothetical protein